MKIITPLVLLCILFSCTNNKKNTTHYNPEMTSSDGIANAKSDLTIEQQNAFEALNTLQIGTDLPNRIYSTFANIDQPCYPADTSFIITQSELLMVMKHFVSKNCKYLSVEQQTRLAETSVKAQDEYRVLHCSDDSENENYYSGLPITGTWVMPNVLGRRDVILNW